jgi:mannose-6-phosphate isomerase-like protein (cupin superfamily)
VSIRVFAQAELSPSGGFAAELQGKDAGTPGVSLILVDAEPGRGPSLHTHDYAEVMVILEGESTFTDGERTFPVAAGHIVLIAGGQPHGFTNAGPGRLRQVNIHVADAFATEWL